MTATLRSLDMERALLGAVLNDGSILDRIGFLAPEHFSEGPHAHIFDAAQSLAAMGWQVGFLTLVHRIGNDAVFDGLGGGRAYLANLHAACPAPMLAQDWAKAIHDLAMRRALIASLEQYRATAEADHSRSPAELIEAALEALSGIADDRPGGRTLHSLGEAADALTDRLNRAFMEGMPPEELITTGSRDLDHKLGGWRRRRQYVIGGRTSMGKTTVGTSLTLRSALKGHGVLYVSLEMGHDEIAQRCLADLAWGPERRIEYKDIERGTVDQQHLERIFAAGQRLRETPFEIEDRSALTIPGIQRVARLAQRRLAAKGASLDVIVVDHLGLVRPSDEYRGNLVAQTGEVSQALKALAKDFDCAVLALAQLNRRIEDREKDKRPNLADLRWSGDIEQDADVVMFIFREEHYLEKALETMKDEAKRQNLEAELAKVRNILELNVAKQRGGSTGAVTLFCDVACNVVRDAAR